MSTAIETAIFSPFFILPCDKHIQCFCLEGRCLSNVTKYDPCGLPATIEIARNTKGRFSLKWLEYKILEYEATVKTVIYNFGEAFLRHEDPRTFATQEEMIEHALNHYCR